MVCLWLLVRKEQPSAVALGLILSGAMLLHQLAVLFVPVAGLALWQRSTEQTPARRLLNGLTLDDLRLGGSGIRARLHPPTESFADFLVRRDGVNPRVIQAAGIDSPGLTSCLAIGDRVAHLLSADA